MGGGSILEGAGAPPFAADLLVSNGRIAGIGAFAIHEACTMDCTGRTIAPGFIDGHCRSDLQVLENHPEKLLAPNGLKPFH